MACECVCGGGGTISTYGCNSNTKRRMQNDVVNLEYGTTGAVRSVVVSQEAVDMRNLALGRIAGKNLKLKKQQQIKPRCRDYYAFFFSVLFASVILSKVTLFDE